MIYEKLIREIFYKKFGAEKVDIFDKTKGLEHTVFVVKTDSKEFVIRFPLDARENKCRIQKWAYEKWAALGIRVPKVILCGRDYLIEEKIEGVDMEEANLSLAKQREIMYNLGKLVRKMHTIKNSGFGPLRSNGSGKYRTWKKIHRCGI